MFDGDNSFLQRNDPDSNYFDEIFQHISGCQETNYVTVDEFNDRMNELCEDNHFSVFSYNIRSFNSNSDIFFSIFLNLKSYPKVIHLSETWFTNESTVNIHGYNGFHTIRQTGRSGGSSIYVKKNILSKLVPELSFSNSKIEVCTVEILLQSFSIFLIGIYRPHGESIENFTTEILTLLNNPQLREKNLYCFG